MNKTLEMVCVGALVVLALLSSVFFDRVDSKAETNETHKIGVVVYDVTADEVQMFRNYYENYTAGSFPVEFLYSASVSDWNDEEVFLKDAIEAGAEGFISFNPTDLPQAVELCGRSGVYYMMGSGNISQDLFDSVADDPWFLGCIGPNDDTDYQAGYDMVAAYAEANGTNAASLMVTTGGAANGNHMHEMRARGILAGLTEIYGCSFSRTIDEIVMADAPCEIETGNDSVKVILCPGYDVADKMQASFEAYDAEAVLSVLASSSISSIVEAAESTKGHDVWVGIIDCFSQTNQDLFQAKDAYGNSRLNYISGKYASIVGPSFAAMFQALTADPQMLRPEGKAFHLNQEFWTAKNAEEYNDRFTYSQAIAVNAYSNTDLMNVLQIYNPEATFEDFRALTEASSVEDAVARIGLQ